MLSPRLNGAFICFAAAFGSLLVGYQIAFMGILLSNPIFASVFNFKKTVTITDAATGETTEELKATSVESLIVSLYTLGSIFGSFAVSFVASRFPRKIPILFSCLIVFIGTLIQTLEFPNAECMRKKENGVACGDLSSTNPQDVMIFPKAAENTPYVIMTGRFVSGFGVGILTSIIPLFISEVSTPDIRGILTTINQLMVTFGIVLCSFVNIVVFTAYGKSFYIAGSSLHNVILAMPFFPVIFLFIMMSFVPESPKALLSLGRREAAVKALCAHRSATAEQVTEEFNEMEKEQKINDARGKSSWSEILEKSILKRIAIASTLQVFQQLSGINVVILWAGNIINLKNSPIFSKAGFPFILMTVNMLGTLPGMFLIEVLGRSRLLVLGGFGMFASFIITGFVHTQFGFDASNGSVTYPEKNYWGPVVVGFSSILYILSFASSWGPVVWTYQSEIFPMRVKDKAVGLCTSVNFITGFIVFFTWPYLLQALHKYSFFFFAATTFVMAVFAFFVPETKGLSDSQINAMFHGKKASKVDSVETRKRKSNSV